MDLVYSKDYGQSWKEIWYVPNNGGAAQDTSLYYTKGTLFVAMGADTNQSPVVGKLVDTGSTYWNFVSSPISDWSYGPHSQRQYGLNGFPLTNQLVYYVAANGTLQYSTDGGASFATRTPLFTAFPENGNPGSAVSWLDNPNKIVWTNLGYTNPPWPL